MTLFDKYNEGNGLKMKPNAITVIVDHSKVENNTGAADIEDVKHFTSEQGQPNRHQLERSPAVQARLHRLRKHP